MANEVLDFYILAGAFLVVSFIFTLLIKRFTNAKTFFIISIIKTKKPLWVFDKLAFLGKTLDWLTELGLVLGFGSIAVDYLYGQKLPKIKRTLLFLVSTILMILVFFGFDLLVGKAFSTGIFTKEFFIPIALLFGVTGFAGFLLITLVLNSFSIIYNYFVGQGSCPGIAPVLPGIEIPNVPISIPLYAWIPLLLVVAIHELMHGVVARKEKIPVKSTGVLLLGFLPIGGFVEPDEQLLAKSDERKQLHVYAAGVITNLLGYLGSLVGLIIVFLLISSFFGPWASGIQNQSVEQVQILKINEKIEFCKQDYPSPALGVLEQGMIVKEINGVKVNHSSDVTQEIAQDRLKPIEMVVEKEGIVSTINLTPNELGYFGFVLENIPNKDFEIPQEYLLYSFLVGLLFGLANWFLLFNLLLGMMNYLPFPILDGGRIAPIILAPYLGFLGKNKKEIQKRIVKIFFYTILVLFLINALPLFF